MKKNPLFVLLGISFACFLGFITFVYFVLQSVLGDGTTPLTALSRAGKIGVVELDGVIDDSKKFVQQIRRFEKDRSVKGIIVRIDSPGGAVGPSQEIYEAIQKVRKTKPVVASMQSVAASGGYYAAVGAEKIVANPGTLTGSIGVIMNFMNLSKLYDWAKVNRYILKAGRYKDIGSDLRDMTPEERQIMQTMLDDVHTQFIQAVAQGRKLPVAKVRELATGQVFSGQQAFENKLVDKLGGLDAAVEILKEIAKLEGEPELVYPRARRQGLMDQLIDPLGSKLADAFLSRIGFPADLRSELPQERKLPHGLLYLAPGL